METVAKRVETVAIRFAHNRTVPTCSVSLTFWALALRSPLSVESVRMTHHTRSDGTCDHPS
jgi:hypothetical protein